VLQQYARTAIGSSCTTIVVNSSTSMGLYHHIIIKDLLTLSFVIVIFGISMIGIMTLLHTDNSILVDPYNPAMLFHIVPEWYLLTIYMIIKLVPSAALGLTLVLLIRLLFVFAFTGSNHNSNITSSVTNLIVMFALIAFMGGLLPASYVLAYGKLLTI